MAVWIVLLESDLSAQEDLDERVMRQVLVALGEQSVGLHTHDRCAVQLEIGAEDPADALRTALARWRDAVSRLDLRGWDLVRTEVLTRSELAREIETQGEVVGRVECVAEEDRVRPRPGDGDGDGDGDAIGEDLFHRLFSDPVTGLPTREVFWSRLERALAKDDEANAVVCVEVDEPRGLDSRFEGTAGEQVLVAVAQRLCQAVRAQDFVAQLGSNAFGILIENGSERAMSAIGERILDGARAAVSVRGEEIVPQVSAGVVLTQPGDTPDTVMGYAEMALSAAQSSGRSGIELFRSGGRWTAEPRSRTTQTHDRLGYLLLMQEATMAANDAATLQDAAEVILPQVCTHTGWAVGRLCLAPPDRPGGLVPPSVWHLPALDRYQALRAATDKATTLSALSVTREALVSGRPGHLVDLRAAPERAAEALVRAGLRGAFVAPVLVGSEVVAVLEFFTDEPIEPHPSLVEVITAVGIQLGRVVERTRAREVLQDGAPSAPPGTPERRDAPDRGQRRGARQAAVRRGSDAVRSGEERVWDRAGDLE